MDSLQFQSIKTRDFLDVLKSFNQLLLSSIGPNGSTKMVVSSGGITVLTSSSTRLIDWIDLNNPILIIVANSMKNQWQIYSDFGLYTGLTCSTLLVNILGDHAPYNTVSTLIKYHCTVCLSLLESFINLLKVDFSSVKHLLKITETVVSSKPLCSSKANISALSVCIVEAFLRGVTKDSDSMWKVSIVVNEGSMSEPPCNFAGILYESPELNSVIENQLRLHPSKEANGILVVLFAVNLTSSNHNGSDSEQGVKLDKSCLQEHEKRLLQEIEETCGRILEAGVTIFACQKVVHPHIKCFLQRRGALVLERMGKKLADSFAALSGALPIGCPSLKEIPRCCIGEIESIKLVERGGKTYLRLARENGDCGVVTILASAAGEQEAAELKVVIHQSLQSLRHLVTHPFVLPGSGCLEVWLAVQLQVTILSHLGELCEEYKCSQNEVLRTLKWFRKTFLTASKSISGMQGSIFIVDSIYNHSWSGIEDQTCRCGLVKRDLCDHLGAEWIETELNTDEENLGNLLSSRKWVGIDSALDGKKNKSTPKLNYTPSTHVDVLTSKLNALRLALETCQSILSIGVVVF